MQDRRWCLVYRLIIVGLVFLTFCGSLAFAQSTVQGSGTIAVQNQPQSVQVPLSAAERFQQQFWRYLTKGAVGYDQWGPFPGKEAEMYEGQSPHGAYLRLIANKIARQNPQSLPAGSILIKENYGEDKTTLMAITVMYRSQGYDPQHNDWYWIKYNPDGSVARTPAEQGRRPIAGRFASCIDCHSGAAGNDYAFVNDEGN